jgi:hypothetical protein
VTGLNPTVLVSTQPTLLAVSCPTSTTCIIAGQYDPSSGGTRYLFETGSLTGTTWSWTAATAPESGLTPAPYSEGIQYAGLSCWSATECEFAGTYTASGTGPGTDGDLGLVENGTLNAGSWSWTAGNVPTSTLSPAPNTTNVYGELNAIACVAGGSCVAAGNYSDTANGRDGFVETEALASGPVIDSVSPEHDPLDGGNTVTITGSGFEAAGLTEKNVEFDPPAGSDEPVLDGTDVTVESDTEITVTAPDATTDAGSEPDYGTTVDVTFDEPTSGGVTEVTTTPAGAGANDYVFGGPKIDSIGPTAGALTGGNTVTITGSGFEAGDLALAHVTFAPTAGGSTPLEA